MAKGLGWPAGIFPLGTPRTRTSEGSIYDAQSMTALLLFPREQRTSIWPDTGQLADYGCIGWASPAADDANDAAAAQQRVDVDANARPSPSHH